MNLARYVTGALLASLLAIPPGPAPRAAEPTEAQVGQIISTGKTVTLELTLTLGDQSVVFSNAGNKPLVITQGDQQVVRGLENALEGMHVGEHKQVTVQPSEGFGVVQSQNFQEVPKDTIPPDLLKEGAELQGDGPHGQTVFFRIAEVKAETVVLDFNHPLAGKTLYFDVTVLDIQ